MTKKLLIVIPILTLTILLSASLIFYGPIIFQEGNPLPQLNGIIRLNFGSEKIIKLDTKENKYITKNKTGRDEIIKLMENKNYQFVEQLGSGYLFQTPTNKSFVITRRQYTQYYSIWKFPSTELETKTNDNLAEQLKECLPKSDMGSWEQCKQLMDQIKNFDDCVNAGFSIMKSNPPQCLTPDGKNFTDETNSTWEMAIQAVTNCEVEKIFQSHNRLVTLKLRNENQLTVVEPKIDDIITIAEMSEDKCGHILIGTE
ncbi:MAG: hypothetical protein COU29_04285 [Candidatus Magasanikbacteria bacterium CG10_big_fil_rev_8_21_14_0_10_36_32]|uniref:Uncharacterized protein n=1 Tax=Candidatus Magasanikbacteria bacterium CG10_big_fil_rev_8_21_14_0_10_36_32 TaxID=1974646 RepID=A0A2M6W5D5_9BACT|nr:MAG: hypothetical protein COU29_04285 [Candidatus Magasanikbacteria bacterium CG10_big_fil_rev_8_21_14_0_10_36_32]